jgi:hypothetical protein
VEDVPDAERDPRNGQALIHFLEWALRKAKHTDEDHSLLVLWGHAFRFAVGFTDTPTGTDGLDFAELSAVLTRFQQKWVADHPKSDGKLDVVGFDACELATIEMAAQLHPFADYLIASQMGIPIPGWPYDQVLDLLGKPRTPPVTPPDLGAYIVRRFCTDYFKKYGTASLTMLDLEKVPQIVDATEELARSLAVAIDRDQDEMDRVDFIFHQSQTWENKPFVDVADLCLNLWRYCADSNVKAAAEALGDLLIRPFPYSRPVYRDDGTLDTSERPFIIEHGRNSHETARLHGVSLYAPHIATDDGDWINECYHWYRKFDFGTTNTWSALINALAQPG